MSQTVASAATEPRETDIAASTTRRELLGKLADVLALPTGRQTLNERAFTADILGALLAGTEEPARIDVARRLAGLPTVPPSLLRRLLLDEAPVAAPLLKGVPNLPEMLLVEAAGIGAEHRALIAERDDITGAVADALLERDETSVAQRILERENLVLSPLRLDHLVQRTQHDVALRDPLLKRPELQPAQGFTMFWWCDASTRRRVLSRFSLDRSVLQDSLQSLFVNVFTDPAPDPLVKNMLKLIDRRHRPRGKNGETVTVEVVERTLTAARARPTGELCEAVGLLAGVGTDTATRALLDPGGEPFAILAKSAGVSRSAFSAIQRDAALMTSREAEGPHFGEARQEELLEVFDSIARDYSRTILRYWDWRPEAAAPARPHAEVRKAPPVDSEGYLGAI